jgi:hypothetical protein
MFGDRQLNEHLVVVREGMESEIERLGRNGLLLVNELATDLSLFCQLRDGNSTGKSLHAQLLSSLRTERLGWTDRGGLGLGKRGRRDKSVFEKLVALDKIRLCDHMIG